jgi:uncharacterized protein YraI
MNIRSTLSIAVLVAASVTAMPALAAVTATATTPLNVRSGPGPQYPVVGVIRDNGQAVVTGCIQGSRWCQVSFNGSTGWAYSKYLAMNQGGQTVVIAQEPSVVPVVPYEAPATAVETVGSAPAPIAGTLVETDAAPIAVAPPPETVSTYVEAHPVQPVYLNGEVVVGAGLPQTVALAPVPNYQYDYAYVNRVPVLVEPQSRRIVYVYQ